MIQFMAFFYEKESLFRFRKSSNMLFKDLMYNTSPMISKAYSFLIILISSTMMYKLGTINIKERRTPK